MSEPKLEDLVVRVQQLERSNRLWKSVALGVAAFLLLVVGGLVVLQRQAMQAARVEADRAREAEMWAREAAQKATDAQGTALQEKKQHQGLNPK
jgi:hypothetical protein